jgi:hypothetical protein
MTPVNFFDRTLIRDALRESECFSLTRRPSRFAGEARGHKRKARNKSSRGLAKDEIAQFLFRFHKGVFPQTSLKNTGRNLDIRLEWFEKLQILTR